MGRWRLYLATGLCALLQGVVLMYISLWGVFPVLLPGLVCLIGLQCGPDRGAECGLLGGALLFLAGATPWQMALLTLFGGLSGALFHKSGGFWGNWLACLPGLAGYEGLQILGHWLLGAGWLAPLRVAGPELLLAAACVPLAQGVLWAVSPHQRRRRRRSVS